MKLVGRVKEIRFDGPFVPKESGRLSGTVVYRLDGNNTCIGGLLELWATDCRQYRVGDEIVLRDDV